MPLNIDWLKKLLPPPSNIKMFKKTRISYWEKPLYYMKQLLRTAFCHLSCGREGKYYISYLYTPCTTVYQTLIVTRLNYYLV